MRTLSAILVLLLPCDFVSAQRRAKKSPTFTEWRARVAAVEKSQARREVAYWRGIAKKDKQRREQALFHLGVWEEKLGNAKAAQGHFETLLTEFPTGAWHRDAALRVFELELRATLDPQGAGKRLPSYGWAKRVVRLRAIQRERELRSKRSSTNPAPKTRTTKQKKQQKSGGRKSVTIKVKPGTAKKLELPKVQSAPSVVLVPMTELQAAYATLTGFAKRDYAGGQPLRADGYWRDTKNLSGLSELHDVNLVAEQIRSHVLTLRHQRSRWMRDNQELVAAAQKKGIALPRPDFVIARELAFREAGGKGLTALLLADWESRQRNHTATVSLCSRGLALRNDKSLTALRKSFLYKLRAESRLHATSTKVRSLAKQDFLWSQKLAPSASWSPEMVYKAATTAWGVEHKPADAAKIWETMAKRYPKNFWTERGLYNAASAHVKMKQPTKAKRTFDQLLKLFPNSRYRKQVEKELAVLNR